MSYPDPRYLGDTGEISGRLRRADAAPELAIGASGSASYLATGASTNGEFGLYRWDMGPESSGPSTHFHRTISESFFILSGSVRLFDGADWTTANPGDFLFVPQGGLHAFRNESGQPASMLILAPGAPREGYFEGLAQMGASGRTPTEEGLAEFYARHDTYWVQVRSPTWPGRAGR